MAIDFPNSPIEGTTYDFGGTRYTFTLVGGAPGYWKVTEPGTAGPATITEINDGAPVGKYVTPDGLDASQYMRQFTHTSNGNPGSAVAVPKNGNIDLSTGGSGGVSAANSAAGLQINTRLASTSVTGVTYLVDSVASTDINGAATANATKVAYDTALASAWAHIGMGQNGYQILSRNWSQHNAGAGLMLQWGTRHYAFDHTTGALNDWTGHKHTNFHVPFASAPYVILCCSAEATYVGNYECFKTHTKSATQFWTSMGNVYFGNVWTYMDWIAIGPY